MHGQSISAKQGSENDTQKLSISINKSAAEDSAADINMYTKLLSTTCWHHATCDLTVTGIAQMVLLHTATPEMTDTWFLIHLDFIFYAVPHTIQLGAPEMHRNWVNLSKPLAQLSYFNTNDEN